MASGGGVTPEKKFTFIDYTPTTKQLVCVLCGDKVIKREYRRKLFHGNTKTEFCLLIEKHLDICIFQDLHTDILCRKCLRNVQKLEETIKVLKDSYNRTLSGLQQSHGKENPTTKRQICDDIAPSKRVLFNISGVDVGNEQPLEQTRDQNQQEQCSIIEQPDHLDRVQVKVTHGTRKSCHILNIDYLPILDVFFTNDSKKIVHSLPQDILDAIEELYINNIREEIKTLCLKRTDSILRKTNLKNLKSLTWDKILLEWTEKAPKFKQLLESLTCNPSQQRNKIKKDDELKSGIVSAGCKLLSVYNQELNAVQHVLSLVLLKGGCKKSAFSRLNSMYDCLSYQATLNIADKYAKDWKDDLESWIQDVKEDRSIELSYLEQIKVLSQSTEWLLNEGIEPVDLILQLSEVKKSLDDHRINMHEGFYFVGDNVDMRSKVRHMTMTNQNKDQHLYQICAYKHRVSGNTLDNTKAQKDILEVPFSALMPSKNDKECLINEYSYLVARYWTELIPCFKAYQNVLPPHIEHKYMKEMSKKTERVNMGVLQKNEQYNDEMTDICEFLHQFVPGHDESDDWTVKPEKVLSGGDYLTFERHKQAQASKRNGRTPSKRLEGLIPKMEEFHNQAEFLKVIWTFLYSPSSARDVGTYYAARNALNARNVTKEPSDDFYASSDLVEKVTKAYVVTGGLSYFGLDSLESQPTTNLYTGQLGDVTEMREYLLTHAMQFVRMYAVIDVPEIPDYGAQSLTLKCRYCSKLYKRKTALRKHEATLHQHLDPLYNQHSSEATSTSRSSEATDFMFNYSKLSLTLGLLYMDQGDSISMGDGERIMRINQFLCLYYKLCNCPKYAHGILETVVQSKVLLTERLAERLIWNRTVNHVGGINTNFPNDLDVEHCNKVFKDDAHSYRGVFTERTLNRVSRSAQKVDHIVKQFDKMSKVTRPSGKHNSANFENDIISLVRQFNTMHLFDVIPGRHHNSFPEIKENPLNNIDIEYLREWIESCLKKFNQKHYYHNY